jgi:hypothetical protein
MNNTASELALLYLPKYRVISNVVHTSRIVGLHSEQPVSFTDVVFRHFISLHHRVQTGYGAHPPLSNGYQGPFP